MRNLKDIILEKLKVTKKSVPDMDEDTIEVPYYEFVIWYTGVLDKKPDEITEDDFTECDFADAIVDSYGNNVFVNDKLAYDFYKKHKDDVVTITIEKMRGPAGDDGDFMNVIDFGDYTFYVDSNENFIDYYLDYNYTL